MAKRPFREVLANIRAGVLDDELTAATNRLVTAVQTTGKAGSLTLKITLKPTKGLALEIVDSLTLNEPTLDQPTTIMFPTVEGNLQLQNPMQQQLPLQVVHHTPQAPVAVATAPAGPPLSVAGT